MAMKVLVTGHCGLIGSVMVLLLLAHGHDVVGLGTDLYEGCTYPATDATVSVPSLCKDVRDVQVEDMTGFDVCLPLAALANDPLDALNPLLTHDINFGGSVHLAKVAKQAGVCRFLLASSCSNYGAAGEAMVDEGGRRDVQRGARRLYESVVASGLTQDDFTGSRYQRTSHVKELLASGTLDTNRRWTGIA